MDSINDFLHKKFGINKYRPSVNVRKDAFYEYLPVLNNTKDQQLTKRLANTIVDLSDICFKSCIDPNHQHYTYWQNKCVKKCVQSYFTQFQDIVLTTKKRIQTEQQNARKQKEYQQKQQKNK